MEAKAILFTSGEIRNGRAITKKVIDQLTGGDIFTMHIPVTQDGRTIGYISQLSKEYCNGKISAVATINLEI